LSQHSGVEGEVLIKLCIIAFEGLAHPYKENIVKFAGKTKVVALPEVGKMLLEAKTA
jgi:hypothetical protein